MQELHIGENDAGQRFDKYLKKLLAEAPGSFVYKEAVLDELSADEEHYLTRISLFCSKKERQ